MKRATASLSRNIVVSDCLAQALLNDGRPILRVTKMPEQDDAEIAALAAEIIRYLDRYPNAGDTLQGIIKWWLLPERYGLTRDRVQRAINCLLADGNIEKTKLAGGEVVYTKSRAGGK